MRSEDAGRNCGTASKADCTTSCCILLHRGPSGLAWQDVGMEGVKIKYSSEGQKCAADWL